jgi:hypothetical protein
MGTKRFYEGQLPIQDQAEKILRNLLSGFDVVFCRHFNSQEIQQCFDVNIFGDSIVISPRKEIPDIIGRIIEFLLDYQENLIVNHCLPSRAVIIRGSYFSLKILGASDRSILGTSNTSVALCGGKSISFANTCFKGLPIGLYVTPEIESELSTEHQVRSLPVRHIDKFPDLFFIKLKKGIDCYLPPETKSLLDRNPNVSNLDVLNSIRASQKYSMSGVTTKRIGLKQPWEVFEPAIEDQDALNEKWIPWILANLGRLKDITRVLKEFRE